MTTTTPRRGPNAVEGESRDLQGDGDAVSQPSPAAEMERLGRLAGGMAHDFNNYLTGILVNVDMALRNLPLDAPGRPLIREIEKAAQHAGELTEQMLQFAGRGHLVAKPLELSSTVRGMSRLLESSVPGGARLQCSLADDMPQIFADAGMVRQLILQLVLNGVDALENEAGFISVATGVEDLTAADLAGLVGGPSLEPGTYGFLEVSDTGRGMDAATLACLFDPYFSTKSRGSGLGMAKVYGIVRSHGGGLRVRSEPGSGSSVRALFPVGDPSTVGPTARPQKQRQVTPEAVVAAETSAAETSESPPLATVLVVDDERFVRTIAQGILEDEGWGTLGAADGLEALDVFLEHRERIDLVLLDLTMPGLNGHETFHRLRQLSASVQVVITSGSGELKELHLPEDCLPPTFLRKPYRPAQLVGALRHALRL